MERVKEREEKREERQMIKGRKEETKIVAMNERKYQKNIFKIYKDKRGRTWDKKEIKRKKERKKEKKTKKRKKRGKIWEG